MSFRFIAIMFASVALFGASVLAYLALDLAGFGATTWSLSLSQRVPGIVLEAFGSALILVIGTFFTLEIWKW
jgi:hypothetical protein